MVNLDEWFKDRQTYIITLGIALLIGALVGIHIIALIIIVSGIYWLFRKRKKEVSNNGSNGTT